MGARAARLLLDLRKSLSSWIRDSLVANYRGTMHEQIPHSVMTYSICRYRMHIAWRCAGIPCEEAEEAEHLAATENQPERISKRWPTTHVFAC